MAEGDTILRTARRLDEALAGSEVAVRAPNPRGRAAGVERLDGRRLERVESHGKHLLLHFDGGLVLHSHLGMNGSWRVYSSDARSLSNRSAWVALSNGSTDAVQLGGSTLRVLEARRLRLDPTLGRLGPDILATHFSVGDAVDSLRRAGPSLQLGEALLDQRLLAGVGNIFKSEGCFAARISPWRRLGELTDAELTEVIGRTRELMLESARGGRQPRSIYRRAGQPCPRCGTALRSRGQGDANRASYWCPSCQR